jgi:hypothetical protein
VPPLYLATTGESTMNTIHNAKQFMQSNAPFYKRSNVETTLYSLRKLGITTDKQASEFMFNTGNQQSDVSTVDTCLVNLINDMM